MGQEIFGVDLAGIIADKVAPGLHDVVITREIAGARTPGNLTGGRAKTYPTFTGIKGIWEDVPRTPPAGVTIELNDRVALLIGDTIPAGGRPQRNDAIRINGITLYVVQLIAEDAVSAHLKYLCRDRKGPDGV